MDDELYVLIAGSRTCEDVDFIFKDLDAIFEKNKFNEFYNNITIVTGNASGVDAIGNQYVYNRNYDLIMMPANWGRFGKQAGFIRNERMHLLIAAQKNRAVICYKDIDSAGRGTMHSIDLCERYRNPLLWNEIKNEGGIWRVTHREIFKYKNNNYENFRFDNPDSQNIIDRIRNVGSKKINPLRYLNEGYNAKL